MVKNKIHPINLGLQEAALKAFFPKSTSSVNNGVLVWRGDLVPTPLSAKYTVKLVYKLGCQPDVFVIQPKLQLAKEKKLLPHVYSTEMQHLCLYYRKAREWHKGMLLVRTIIPWTSEWLQFYELWLPDGNWYGGGIEHETAAETIVTP